MCSLYILKIAEYLTYNNNNKNNKSHQTPDENA